MQRDPSGNSNQTEPDVEIVTYDYPIDALYENNFKNVIYAKGTPVNAEAEVDYISASSGLTTRKLTVHAFLENSSEVHILAFCHTRMQLRTFKGSRVIRFRVDRDVSYPFIRSWLRALPVLQDQEIMDARLKQLETQIEKFVKIYAQVDAASLIDILLSDSKELFQSKGWIVRIEGGTFTFWRTRPNGILLKHPHAKLEFHEYCETNIIDVDARHVIKNRYPNTKPWVVRTKDSGETSFETHGTAFNHLTEYLVHTKWKSTDGSP